MADNETPAAEQELTDEDILSQIMLDMMTLKTLLIQKGIFKQEEFDAVSEKVAAEITATEPAPEAGNSPAEK